MELIVLAVLGVILAVLSLFILTRKIESAIFYSILAGPSLGASLGGFLSNLVTGDLAKAIESFKFLPFFLAPIDEAFFADANQLLMVVGAVLLALWLYVLLHFMLGKFHVWALPILPAVLWVAGMSLPFIRMRLIEAVPFFAFLLEPFYGLPALVLVSVVIAFLCYLWWRHSQPELELPLPDKLKFKD